MSEISLKDTNIVILAKNHNPSIVSKDWLKSYAIIEESEKVSKFTHTPILSFIETDRYRFLVDPDRLQISATKIDNENIQNLPLMVEKYINQLPEIPYKAIGLNYTYDISPGEETFANIFSPNADLFKKLFSDHFRLGGIVFFDYHNFRVTLNLKPAPSPELQSTASFNFHCDVSKIEEIIKRIKSYLETKEKTLEILKGLLNE